MNEVLRLAGEIGKLMEAEYPRLVQVDRDPEDPGKGWRWVSRDNEGVEDSGIGIVDKEHVREVAEGITEVVAEILQAWLDAGSEREVTMEDLGPVIEEHVKGWSNAGKC